MRDDQEFVYVNGKKYNRNLLNLASEASYYNCDGVLDAVDVEEILIAVDYLDNMDQSLGRKTVNRTLVYIAHNFDFESDFLLLKFEGFIAYRLHLENKKSFEFYSYATVGSVHKGDIVYERAASPKEARSTLLRKFGGNLLEIRDHKGDLVYSTQG